MAAAFEAAATLCVTAFRVGRARLRAGPAVARARALVTTTSADRGAAALACLAGNDACTSVDDDPAATRGASDGSCLIATSQNDASTEPETAAKATTALSTRVKLTLMKDPLTPDNQ